MRDPHVRLTDEEQRRLAALEAALMADDPDLARRLRFGRRLPIVGLVLSGPPARGLTGSVLLTAGTAVVLASVMLSTVVAFVGCVLMVAGGYLLLTCGRAVRTFRRFAMWFEPRFFRSGREHDASGS
jgi:hypothetical protein